MVALVTPQFLTLLFSVVRYYCVPALFVECCIYLVGSFFKLFFCKLQLWI